MTRNTRAKSLANAWLINTLTASPRMARRLGLHSADGVVAKIHPTEMKAELSRAIDHMRRVDLFLTEGGLAPEVEHELILTRSSAASVWHELCLWKGALSSNMLLELFDVASYFERPYAPLDERLAKAIQQVSAACAAVPDILTWAHIGTNSHAREIRRTIEGLERLSPAAILSASKQTDPAVSLTATRAVQQLRKTLEEIKEWAQNGDVKEGQGTLDPESFAWSVKNINCIRATPEQLWRLGWKLLKRDTKLLEKALVEMVPDADPWETLQGIHGGDLTWDQVIPALQSQVDKAREELIASGLVPILDHALPIVVQGLPFIRPTTVEMEASGPFEIPEAEVNMVRISPPPDDGTCPDVYSLASTAAHECYPGHLTMDLHRRLNPSEIARALPSQLMSEGWAHYSEALMLDRPGLHPLLRIGWLKKSLLRDCRLLVSVGMHAAGRSEQWAIDLFKERAFMDEGNAREQVHRGIVEPGYIVYAVGRRQIEKMRDMYIGSGKGTLVDFHREIMRWAHLPPSIAAEEIFGLR